MNDYKFGNFLCMLREKKGYTQADIAREMGVTPAAVSKWENGESKPRVNVLFKLANTLDVRAEELIEGRYIPQETLDQNAVKLISDRYEYLRRTDSYTTAKVKFKRILAFLIDWNIAGLIVLALLLSLFVFYDKLGLMSDGVIAPVGFLTMLLYPVLVIMRDFMWGGRSLGKRITGLVILDLNTASMPKKSKLLLRDLFFFLQNIDGIVMLVSGKSIGDYVAHTVVVQTSDLGKTLHSLNPINAEEVNKKPADVYSDNTSPVPYTTTADNAPTHSIEQLSSYTPPKNNTKRNIALAVVSVILAILMLFLIISFALGMSRNTDEYQLAYDYMVNSELMQSKGYSENKIHHCKYSSRTYTSADGISEYRTEIGFRVGFSTYTVVLHKDETDNWYVCDECTDFK
ncbi:MAG: helix-turn-helix domain-containing protein [Ruminococcus sp.]|nr:helix-turn-helix domain-containing protein [Ruminococcus sp.]